MKSSHALSLLWVGLLVSSVAVGSVGAVQPDPSAPARIDAPRSGTNADLSQSNIIQTEHFEITYEEGARSDAESIAAYADTYYELLFQRFGVAPPSGRTSVEVVDAETVECDGSQRAGCYEGIGATIVVTSADRGLFYHELTHRFQAHVGILGPGAFTPEVVVEGTAHHVETPVETIAASATFSRDAIDLGTEDVAGDEYAEQALFVEYVLHEYGRAGYDTLFMDRFRPKLSEVADEEYTTIVEEFYAQLDAQKARMEGGGASSPGFTYDPFLVEHGEEVTFDARTPGAIRELGRTWYGGDAASYEWDFDGDGEIEAKGPTVTRTIDDPVGKEVTLYVTVDGERHAVTQELLPAASPSYDVAGIERGASTLSYMGTDSWADLATAPGRTFSVNATVRNDGDIAGSDSVELTFNGQVVDTRPVTVPAGETRTVTLSYRVPEDIETSANHDYRVRVGDERSREKTVYAVEELRVRLAPYGGPTVDPSLRGGTTAETRVTNDTRVRVSIPTRVENNDVRNVATTIELYLDDRLVGSRSALLAAHRDSPAFNVTTPSAPGEYELRAVVADGSSAMNATNMSHTLVVEGVPPSERPYRGLCGVNLAQYCTFTLESVDAPETVTVGTEATFAAALQDQGHAAVGGQFAVQMGVDGESERVVADANKDGAGTASVTTAFESPGTHNVTVNGRVVHTVDVVEPTTTESTTTEPTTGSEPTSTADTTTARETTTGNGERADTTDVPATPGAPGFGLVAALVAVLFAALLARR